MNQLRTLALGWLSLSIFSLVQAQTPDLADMIDQCERSVVRVEVSGADLKSQGSGFIVDSSGMMVTNFHVLAGAEIATVHFPNGSSYPILGVRHLDPNRDIAIAMIEGSDFPVLKGATGLPRKGETIVGLGSPLGLSFTASNGIVSAIRTAEELRKELDESDLEGTWIQVNAALSPGSSGGPLVNTRGEFVAMSTLASSGVAQNINFGISAEDIKAAVETAKTKPLQSLAASTAKAGKKESRKGGRAEDSLIQRKVVPPAAFESYVKATMEQMKALTKQMLADKKIYMDILKEMKAGQEFIPSTYPTEAQIVRGQNRKGFQWYFRDRTIKQQVIQKAEARAKELMEAIDVVNKGNEKDATYALATKYGPVLNPQQEGSIGFMAGAKVVHAFNKHDLIISFQDVPYLMYMDSTAGLFRDEEIDPTAVYVAGTTSAPVGGTTIAVTILQSVTDNEIRKTIFGEETPRVWKSKDGKFSVEAILVSKTESEVVLRKKADGKEIKVPNSKLSDEDLQYLHSR